jgi:DNA-directed RNA polymerase I, II, and III subunit RPABC5
MIIPIKCVTCGFVLADKYRYYQEKVKQKKIKANEKNEVKYLTNNYNKKTIEGEVLDNLNIRNPCCRRHFLTNVEIF